jgi:hypothetical protein
LSHLKRLAVLEWNYYDENATDIWYDWDTVDSNRLTDIVASLAHSCSKLAKVNFCLTSYGGQEMTSLRIDRNGEGSFGITVMGRYDYTVSLCTSAWKSDMYTDV